MRNTGLDVARLIAMAFVAVQHALSVCDIESPRLFSKLDLGQLGVVVFFSISGYLAVQKGDTKPISWLRKRLSRIFVPYWVTLTGVLIANHYQAYKPISLPLVLSEYLGVAGWTHRGELIGVHFWFISLLLFCYVIAAIIRACPVSFPVIVLATVGWIWYEPHYAGCTLAFLTGIGFGKISTSPSLVGISAAAVGAMLLGQLCNSAFSCVAVAAGSLGSLSIPWKVSRQNACKIADASNMSYHFYLVHGPVYLAVALFVSPKLWSVLSLGTFIAVSVAIVLRNTETAIRYWTSHLSDFVQKKKPVNQRDSG
ncbi:acyltransferase [bacterium]|nr:acyltransferase [bacterium]